MANLPADLPENWTEGQTISPNGTEVGLDEKHGYNYLMKQVNNAQNGVNALNTDMESVAQESTAQEILNNTNTIKSNVAGVKSKTDLIGSTTDTGGSATAGTVMGKLNKLISTSLVSVIKSVQRGSIAAATTTLAQSVDPDKCIVLLESRYSGTFAIQDSNKNYVFYQTTATKFVSLTETTLTVTLGSYYDGGSSRPTAKTNPTTYQIIEFY